MRRREARNWKLEAGGEPGGVFRASFQLPASSFHIHRRSGNILPFALIMTLTILMAGIGIGVVVLEGIQRAKDTDESVGAYYMADSGVERQLFEIRKNNQPISYVNTLGETYPNGSVWRSTGALETPTAKTIPTVATSSFAVLDLFDPDNLLAKPGIGALNIKWTTDPACTLGSSTLEASYAYWDLSGPTPQWPSDNQFKVYPKDASGNVDITDLDVNRAYRLRLRFFNCAANNVVITTYASPGVPKAFPGDLTLSAEGTYGRATQKIAVTMPKQDVLSGLFGYVLFSECTLYKDEAGTTPVCPP